MTDSKFTSPAWEYAKTHSRGDAVGRADAYRAGYEAALRESANGCPCGHEDDKHVHYCSAELDIGSCDCDAEYVRLEAER